MKFCWQPFKNLTIESRDVLRWEARRWCFSEIKPKDPQLYNSLTANKHDSTTGHESHESSIANQVRSHFPLQMPYKYSPGHLWISWWILMLCKGSISILYHIICYEIFSLFASHFINFSHCFFASVQKSHSPDPLLMSLTVPIQSDELLMSSLIN